MPKEWDGSWTPRHRTIRHVLDDFGAMRVVHICRACRVWFPLSEEHFVVKRRGRDGSVVEWDDHCRECGRIRNAAHRKRRPLERRQEIYRRRYEREMEDPERRAKRRERQRRAQQAYRERDPEKAREIRRKSDAKMRADPKRYAKRLEDGRMYHHMRKEREGLKAPVKPSTSHAGPELPVGPLLAAIEAKRIREGVKIPRGGNDGDYDAFCQRIGVEPRTLLAWRSGERTNARFDNIDRILINVGWNWFDVYEKPVNGHSDDPEAWKAYRAACLAFEGELVE